MSDKYGSCQIQREVDRVIQEIHFCTLTNCHFYIIVNTLRSHVTIYFISSLVIILLRFFHVTSEYF